jgi:hypothetical protein
MPGRDLVRKQRLAARKPPRYGFGLSADSRLRSTDYQQTAARRPKPVRDRRFPDKNRWIENAA